MKTNKNILYTIGAVAILLQLSLTACTDSYGEWNPEPATGSSFTLAMELPRPKTAELTTRAMTDDEESEIQEITLLLFTAGPGNTELLESTHSIPGTALTRNNRLYTTTATLEPGTYSTFIVLANSAALLTQNPLLAKGTPHSQIEEELLLSLDDGTHWNATPPNSRRIPMWGMIEGGSAGIVINNIPKNYSIKLFRMLASIDIVIEQEDDQSNPLPAFDLYKIHLCNFYRNGRMIPISNTSHYDGTKLLDVSLPADASRLAYADPLEYDGSLADATLDPDIIIRHEIYTFEQPRSNGEEESEAPFLIIEGEYEDTGYNSYYRIDFVERLHEDPDDPEKAEDNFLPLLRNYTYNIVVKEILGPGYRSFEDAAICKPFNTVSDVFRFDDSDSESVQFDGKYFLSVSHDSIRYDKEPGEEILFIKTDSPLGWKIGDLAFSGGDGSTGWFTLDKTEGTRDESGEVKATVTAYNPTGPNPTPREATFTVTCGRMEHTIQVTQSYLAGISLEIVNSAGEPLTEIRFRSNPHTNSPPSPDENFTVRWSGPNGCKMEVIMVGDRVFPFETTGPNAIYEGRELTTGQENHTFTIHPIAFTKEDTDPVKGNPFLQDGANITFSVSNEQETIRKNIYIRHQCISIVFRELEGFTYMGDGDEFKVYSNTSWRLKAVDTEVDGMFLTEQGTPFQTMVGTSGLYNIAEGVPLRYSISSGPPPGTYTFGQAGRKMFLTFEDIEGFIADHTINITAATPDPNCYMVQAGGTVAIPLRKLFWIWEKELGETLDPLTSATLSQTPQIIWQTTPGLIQNATLSGSGGDYRDYTLNVTAGSTQEGNALIAIRRGTGTEILWSFHIWVTGYNPDNGGKVFPLTNNVIFMDRNLGSNGNHNTFNPEGNGFSYQWGRKDPFPGTKVFDWEINLADPDNQRDVFNSSGSPVYTTFQNVAVENNLRNSILNPTIFYNTGEMNVMDDWYTSISEREYQNDFLWNDRKNRKSLYDPCPAGWRVPDQEAFGQLFAGLEDGTISMSEVDGIRRIFTKGSDTWEFLYAGKIKETLLVFAPYAGYLWTNNTASIKSQEFTFYADPQRVNGFSSEPRQEGHTIRCVKDTHTW